MDDSRSGSQRLVDSSFGLPPRSPSQPIVRDPAWSKGENDPLRGHNARGAKQTLTSSLQWNQNRYRTQSRLVPPNDKSPC